MTEEAQGRTRRRTRLAIAVLALTILAAIIVIPPMVSINRYKSRIARAMSASLGRPVHMSGVELRLFPRPAFVLTDLTVEEDPAYSAEPVLHANTVTADVRFFPLWRGRLEISQISVDEASLNLVRAADGRWNLDTLFRTAAQSRPGVADQKHQVPLPYLQATNSRINIMRGYEKLPYSLVNADLSFWEENPGDWRVRIKGQPARTDVNLDLGDTGIVQLEGRMLRATQPHRTAVNPEMRQMPIHIEMEWRNAQLGQLSRLLIGSDPGWRGDLTAEMKLDGTAESAQVTTRLRAAGVHRAEFAPAVPLDFDANCNFAYHHSAHTIDNLACDSPLGDGRLHLAGNLPSDGQPKLSLELQRIPAQAILDALRTVRSQLGADLSADGALSGKLVYDTTPQPVSVPTAAVRTNRSRKTAALKPPPAPQGPLTGSITLDALKLSGGSLNQPVQIQKVVFEPAIAADGKGEVLTGTATLPSGAPTPLIFTVQFTLSGYHVTARGSGTPTRVRQLAHAAGLNEARALDAIAGDPVSMDLTIEGPWLPASDESLAKSIGETASANAALQPLPDRLTGTVTLHNANWKTDALPAAVEIPQATLHLSGGVSDWDPVTFAYGPLKGTARIEIPAGCAEAAEPCIPTVNLEFPTLDAAELQSTLLGSQQKGTLLSHVIARLTPSTAHTWPAFQGTLKAGSLLLGPVTLQTFSADIKVAPAVAEITALDTELLGGQVHITGKIENGDQPSYSLEGNFQKLDAAQVCRVFAIQCTGASFNGDGKIDLAGYQGKDLASSAKGTLHFEWKKGSVARDASVDATPPVLIHFDNWTGDADIANGALTLKENQVQQGKRKTSVGASITFTDPPKVAFASPKVAAKK